MFIVCPSCSGPYRIPADQIAPLVQTACPHCEYRIILDFEAANEPSLREAGHQFAQGFESAEAYASVYDHVTSKPDAQPRLGVTAVAGQAQQPQQVQQPQQATGTGGRSAPTSPPASVAPTAVAATPTPTPTATPVNRPLQQRPPSGPHASPSASASGVRSAGSKTVLQVPSKKPVSMDPRSGDSPSLSGAGSSSMRAGRGVDVLDEQPTEARSEAQEQSDRRPPPHTPPTANIVSSAPPASEVPPPPREDIAALSGSHPAKHEAVPAEIKPTAADVKAVIAPTETKSSSAIMYIVIALVIAAIVAVVMLNRA